MAQTSTIILLTGDYAERLVQLADAASRAEKDDATLLMGERHPREVIAEEYEALKAEAEQAARDADRVVTLTAVGRKRWRELKAAHPPRTDGDPEAVKGDRLAGVNTESVEDDLVHASVTTPTLTSRAAFDEWADALSEGEWQTILLRAWQLANGASVDPKSLPPWRTPSGAEN
jgi:hypothetical protein